jgi:hypothetical protein
LSKTVIKEDTKSKMRITAEEHRRSWRFPTVMKGCYFIEEKKGEGKECTIINISLNGASLEFYTCETISVKTKLFLEIFPPDGEEPVSVEGRISWVKQDRKDCVCGIKLTEKLSKGEIKILKV